MNRENSRFFEFGSFRIDAANRLLLRNGDVVPVPPKTFDVLLALVEDSGQVIQKDELMRRVWPDTFVEEANLSNHIFTLRKALGEQSGDGFIKTIPRRGYRFVAEVTEIRNDGGDVIVSETSRSRVIIEEQTESVDTRQSSDDDENALSQTRAANAGSREMARPLATRRFRSKVLVIGVIVLLAAAVGGTLYLRSREVKQPSINPTMSIQRLFSSSGVGAATISPDGKFVAVVENYPQGAGTIRVRQIDTNSVVQLIPAAERVFGGTSFSSDSAFVYYTAYDKSDPKGALYRVPVLGGPPTKLLENFGSMFSLSPDGSSVTFYRWEPDRKKRHLIISNLDGTKERSLLVLDQAEAYFDGGPAWSPDGKMIAFARTTVSRKQNLNSPVSLFVIDVTNLEAKQITTEEWIEIGKTTWTSDGSELFFVGLRRRTGNQLYRLIYPDGRVNRITNELLTYGNYGMGVTADSSALSADIWDFAGTIWSVDANGDSTGMYQLTNGKSDGSSGIVSLADGRVAFATRAGDKVDLLTMRDDGTDVRPITANSFYQSGLSATRDGRYLVFASDRAGDSHIFRMDADGSNLTQLTYGRCLDTSPDCSPDGRWLVYASFAEKTRTLWRVSIDGGQPTQLCDYESDAPCVSPNGEFISCIIPSPSYVKVGSIAIIPSAGGAPIKSFEVMPFAFSYMKAPWTPDGESLVYAVQDKKAGNLWKQSLIGGAPQQLTDFKSDSIFNFTYSYDGRRLLISRGQVVVNVVVIRNFR